MVQCAACNLFFNRVSIFDKHRTGSHDKHTRRCRTIEEMKIHGMVQNKRGVWLGSSFDPGQVRPWNSPVEA